MQRSSVLVALPLMAQLVVGTLTNSAIAATPVAQTSPDWGIEIQDNTACSFITGNAVNIRRGPGTNHKVVTQLNRGDGVRAVRRQGNWVAIAARVYGYPPNEKFVPLQGWVYNAYINGCSEDQFDRWRTP